ncbi:MAG: hypothetical protein GC171_16365 [Terrimonas sp.]|nr:hypothetical protein [Terrimonas sp.]
MNLTKLKEEQRPGNMRLASCGVKCLNSSSVFQLGLFRIHLKVGGDSSGKRNDESLLVFLVSNTFESWRRLVGEA